MLFGCAAWSGAIRSRSVSPGHRGRSRRDRSVCSLPRQKSRVFRSTDDSPSPSVVNCSHPAQKYRSSRIGRWVRRRVGPGHLAVTRQRPTGRGRRRWRTPQPPPPGQSVRAASPPAIDDDAPGSPLVSWAFPPVTVPSAGTAVYHRRWRRPPSRRGGIGHHRSSGVVVEALPCKNSGTCAGGATPRSRRRGHPVPPDDVHHGRQRRPAPPPVRPSGFGHSAHPHGAHGDPSRSPSVSSRAGPARDPAGPRRLVV